MYLELHLAVMSCLCHPDSQNYYHGNMKVMIPVLLVEASFQSLQSRQILLDLENLRNQGILNIFLVKYTEVHSMIYKP